MPKRFVFITYAPADEQNVLPLRERLNRKGIPFWCDPAPHPQSDLFEIMKEKLLCCSHLLFYASEECLDRWSAYFTRIKEQNPAILLFLPKSNDLSLMQKILYEEFPAFFEERFASKEASLCALTEHPFFDAFTSPDTSPRFGTLSYLNQNRYEGDLLFCRPHGKGTMTEPNGRVEEGSYVDGLLHGWACIREKEIEIYRGWHFMGKRQGEGTLRLGNGIYEGSLCERQPHGKGRLRYFNDNLYEGEFHKGNPQGKGIFYTKNGPVFQGYFSTKNPRLMPAGELSCTYPDRGEYQGGVVGGKSHGRGILLEGDGSRYEGEFTEDQRHGKGILYLANGDRYEGDFQEDRITGLGKYSYACGDFYHGEFQNGKRHGFGSYRSADGNVYEGQFSENLRSGRGVFRTADGKIFSGAFSQGAPMVGALLDSEGKVLSLYLGGESHPPEKPHTNPLPRPFAILTLEDQSTYLGETEQGKPHGYGKRISPEGEVLEGSFENGVCNGKGRFSSDGRSYEGNLENGIPHGYGVMQFGPGGEFSNATYRGYFQNGTPHGKGTMIFPDYGTYFGLFHEGKKRGKGEFVYQNGTRCSGEYDDSRCQGTIRFPNGDRYEGEFWLTHPCGKGRLTLREGTVYEGSFEREQFCDERTGTGSIHFSNGDEYQGPFRNGRPEQAGVFRYANGDVYEGEFLEGKRMGKGVYTSANGNRFEGSFFEDAPSHGTLFAPDGGILAVYENGKKQKPTGGSV